MSALPVNPLEADEVIVIDDEPNELFVISVILKNAGIRVRTFNNSEAGLRSAIEQPASLVLLDWAMPGVNGLEVCKTLKSNPETSDVPVVFCTGISNPESMLTGFNAGAVDFIRKPFSAGEVISRVKVHLELRRARLELERTITELRNSEAEARRNGERYQCLFENGNDAIFVHSIDNNGNPGKFLEVNGTACTLLGYRRDELLQMTTTDINAPEARGSVEDNRKILLETGRHIFERLLMARDGRRFPVEINAHRITIDGRNMVMSIARDITERKRSEKALLKSKDDLNEAQRVAKIGSWHWDAVTKTLEWSDELYKIYERDPMLPPADFAEEQASYTPESAANLTNVVRQAVETGGSYVIDLQRKTADGSVRWVQARGEVIRDADGKITGLRGTSQDITDRRLAEEALQRNRAQLSIAIETARLGPWEYDVASDTFTFNDQFYRILKTTAEAMGGYTMSSAEYTRRFVHPESVELVGAEIRKAIETDDPDFSRQLEHRMIYADGTIGYMSVSFSVVKDASGRTVKTCGVNQDFTERKRAEEERRKLEQQLHQTQKLESLGILAGGIAHDFNNLLGGIFGYMDLARDASAPDGKAAGYLSKALTTFARAKDLTQQLLTFSKGGAPVLTTGSIVPLLKETTLFALSGSKVSSLFDIDDQLGSCEFDENQIGQVVDNIVINAVQAMPLGGTLTVTAKNIEIAEGESVCCNAGRYIRCSFSDTGIGIPADIIPRIFDPFFTTKQKGNGLGLATAYSIIQKHRGDITVTSEPGKGTTFSIILPVTNKKPVSRKNTASVQHKGSGNILIMDDEDYIREIVGEMAESMGYTPEYASHGQEALDLLRAATAAGKQYVAVIMDLTIPGGRGGRETIEELRRLWENIPVFVASGYSDDPVMADPEAFGFTDKIGKPFRSGELRKLFARHLK